MGPDLGDLVGPRVFFEARIQIRFYGGYSDPDPVDLNPDPVDLDPDLKPCFEGYRTQKGIVFCVTIKGVTYKVRGIVSD